MKYAVQLALFRRRKLRHREALRALPKPQNYQIAAPGITQDLQMGPVSLTSVIGTTDNSEEREL